MEISGFTVTCAAIVEGARKNLWVSKSHQSRIISQILPKKALVKFDRAVIQSILTRGDQVEIIISGQVTGITFEGSDSIRVINGNQKLTTENGNLEIE